MKVKVVKLLTDDRNRNILNNNMSDYISLYQEFTVYGINFEQSSTYFQIYNNNHLLSVPADLFIITDSRVSKYWEIRRYDDSTFSLWPIEFYREYFHDDLSEKIPSVIESFEKVKKNMDREFQ